MRGTFFFLALLLFAQPVPAQHLRLDGETTKGRLGPALPTIVELADTWRYRAGDDPAWADPNYDDSAWATGHAWFGDGGAPAGWDGTGWFRFRLTVDDALLGQPLSLLVSHLGALEVYIDGERVLSSGRIGDAGEEDTDVNHHYVPDVARVTFTRAHVVIAVRSHGYRGPFEDPKGIRVAVGNPAYVANKINQYVLHDVTQRSVVSAATFAVAAFHLLLFVFYPKRVANLYFGLFALCAFFLAFLPIPMNRGFELHRLGTLIRLFQVSMAATTVMGIRFLYSLYYARLPRLFWAWVALGVLTTAVFWNGPTTYVGIFVLLGFVEIFRIIILSVANKRPYAWLVGIGFCAFALASSYQIIFEILTKFPANPYVYLHGMFAMVVFMSVGVARSFAETSRLLEAQIVEIKELSDRAVEQERHMREEEVRMARLEADNALKAKELEEARKRQEVLDELAAANEELRRTQARLVQSEKMASLGSLVAGVAHEINTPVGAITSMHDTLVKATDRLKKTVRELLPGEFDTNSRLTRPFKVIDEANAVIESGSSRVTNIVKRLRSFARLDEAELDTVDIHEGLEDTLTIVHHQLKRNVTIHKNYGNIPRIACYPGQLNQVFLNLLVNAGQAIEEQGEVTITTERDGDFVIVKVADTGVGIPPERIGRVFDPGFTTKGVGVGTGLGLSICYQIVHDHQGEISVESAVGKGTTFTVRLPVDLEERMNQGSNKQRGS